MKISTSQVTKLTISGVPSMDAIAVILEDFGPEAGKITITSAGEAWTYFWGSMGKQHTIRSFFSKCSTPYLVGKLGGGLKAMVPDEDDEALGQLLKKEIVKLRRENSITKEKARDLWGDAEYVSFGEHRALCEEVLGDDWWFSMPRRVNPDYMRLTRIVDTVKAGLAMQNAQAEMSPA